MQNNMQYMLEYVKECAEWYAGYGEHAKNRQNMQNNMQIMQNAIQNYMQIFLQNICGTILYAEYSKKKKCRICNKIFKNKMPNMQKKYQFL